MSDSSTNKFSIFINRAFHDVKDVAHPDENDSAAVTKVREQLTDQLIDWGKDIGKDFFKEALCGLGSGKEAAAGEEAAATGIGSMAGPAFAGTKAVIDVAKIYHAQINQANAAAGLPEQSFLQSLAIGCHLTEPPSSAGVIDFAQTGREAGRDLAALTAVIRAPDLPPLERAGNYVMQQEAAYAKRLAEYNQRVQATEKIDQLANHADNDFWTWSGRGAAVQEAYYAAFGRNFADQDADLEARMKEVRGEVDRQRVVNQREFQTFHKNGPDFIEKGRERFVQESLNDYAADLQRKRTAHQEDIPAERALVQIREQGAIPDSPAGKDILAGEKGRAAAANQATSAGCPCEDILNHQLDEQTKIARTLDEISRKGLQFVTGVGLEGL